MLHLFDKFLPWIDSNVTAEIRSLSVGPEWISFDWTTSVPECRASVSGFYLIITPNVSTPNLFSSPPNSFISMADCYPNLSVDQDIPYNTSTSSSSECLGLIEADILPCSNYSVSLIPQFDSALNGAVNLSSASTPPGNHVFNLTFPFNIVQ